MIRKLTEHEKDRAAFEYVKWTRRTVQVEMLKLEFDIDDRSLRFMVVSQAWLWAEVAR